MTLRIPFTTAMREAAVTLLKEYAASVGVTLQVYRARPKTLMPPTGFVDRVSETFEYPSSVTWRQRTPRVEVIVLWGLFDSGDAVDQRDQFVDGFLDWVTDRVHAAGASTVLGIVSVDDIPDYVNDWMTPEAQRTYYATRFVLEGFAGA